MGLAGLVILEYRLHEHWRPHGRRVISMEWSNWAVQAAAAVYSDIPSVARETTAFNINTCQLNQTRSLEQCTPMLNPKVHRPVFCLVELEHGLM